MSKIFDGLQHGATAECDLILSAIGDPGPASSQQEQVVPASAPTVTKVELPPTQPVVQEPPAPTSIHKPDRAPSRMVSLSRIVSCVTSKRDASGEQYRIARTKIAHHPDRPRVIVISSVAPGDGKTTTAIRLAAAFSLGSHGNVLLVDADFRRNSVSMQLSAPVPLSLTDVLEDKCSVDEAILNVREFPNLSILTAGNPVRNAAELLDSDKWRHLCQLLRKQFQYIIIDSPPMFPFADYDLLAAISDGVVLIATPDHTPRTSLAEAILKIPANKFMGVVLNRVPRFFLFKSPENHYYSYYESGSDDQDAGAKDKSPIVNTA